MQFHQIFRRPVIGRLTQAAMLTGCIAVTATAMQSPPTAMAQTGLTLFSGVDRQQELSYAFDFGGQPNKTDRYYLRIKKPQMKLAVSRFVVKYPDYFNGSFDPEDVAITVNGKDVDVQEVIWDKDNYRLEIYPQEPVPAKSDVKLVLSNMRNPGMGMYYFRCLVQAPGDVPIWRDLGTWIISIMR